MQRINCILVVLLYIKDKDQELQLCKYSKNRYLEKPNIVRQNCCKYFYPQLDLVGLYIISVIFVHEFT